MKNYTLIFLKLFVLLCLSLPLQAQILPCSFMATPNPNHPGTVDFSMNPFAGNNVVWDFGDGTSGTGVQISHAYNTVGPVYVCVTALDSAQRIICTFCDTVFPNGNPTTCSFTSRIDPSDTLGMIFVSSGGPHSSVSWDFGDGSVGTGGAITHHYPSSGNYIVCMTVVDSTSGAGQTCTNCFPITVPGGPHGGNCSFTTSSTPAGGGTFTFASNSISTPNSTINWDFGDGTSGYGSAVTHTFPANGVYAVCMTELDSNALVICTNCDTVTVNNIPVNNCNFTYSANTTNYLSVQFSSQSLLGGNIIWDFGDGSTGSGAITNHTYTADGLYNVCITVQDLAGNTLCHSCHLINIRNPNQNLCNADFQAVSLGLMGYFIDLSSVNPATATYSWDFGDGNNSTLRFPQHQYSAPGTYTVCLNVTDSNCTDQYCAPLVVDTSINNPIFCNAYFVALQMAPYQLTVVNMSSGINLNFHWDFGDGTTSNQTYPSHSYANTGSYLLCLTVTGGGCTATYCDTVSVDSTGRILRLSGTGFTINVVSPDQLTGITHVQTENFVAIYPNPVADLLNVKIDSRGESSYRIFSFNGAEVASGIFNKDNNQLNTDEWESGFYMLEITRNDGLKNYRKIVKE